MRDQSFSQQDKYKDFDINLTRNPLTGDIGVKKDKNAIEQSLKNLIYTNFYERPFNPEIGTDLNRLLFENSDPTLIADIRDAIHEVVENYEPRVRIRQLIVEDLSDQNGIRIQMYYSTVMDESVSLFNYVIRD